MIGASIDELFDEIGRREEAQKQAERQRDLYAAEAQHRVKNLLAVVQAIISQTLVSERSSPESPRCATASARWCGPIPRSSPNDRAAGHRRPRLRRHRALRRHQERPDRRFRPAAPDAAQGGAGSVAGPARVVHQRREIRRPVHSGRARADPLGDRRWAASAFLGGNRRPAGPRPEETGFGTILIRESLEAGTDGQVLLDYAEGGLRFIMRAPLDRVADTEASEAAPSAAQ
jgi:hypothetical protein